ncbi:Holliday junction ATP-dependent DNA helicase ruvA [Vibrio nigripulchritudo MADA3029]|uniref:Holliday junction branch migration protein RuvA n=1 Tax=Vibrio nigripulchritudo TaxID=28173 RepID=UPI0003B18969|nr:Holliday junction branch migration protein RuvA [Vibrio nigripulchritudo]CCN48192.1 Holliday junction ATP-dependent DNA helicase ruvA [Vibrio nigripulchritudo MADA3020]CCN54814.1 Holliday junction ATP-dependent DNA helicase ruvA [Vibrio nigripulchritudo MADA3021]CCN58311.1 Holliday junction ATP-dependent DNA helicase ruvA [Vibrio nigripulchritudo MADA3029]CCN71008.1 Holliday junction ATP-dependent DNA helicase ruvA [Vibrio nigripulchritudo SFn118]
MIGRLRGILIEKQPPELLIEVSGVGYEVQMPMSCFYELPNVGEEAIIYTHFVVREDAQLLYGFNTVKERALFREVIKANGVGPKLGLGILSGMTAGQFVSCVEREDISTLVKLPGVGKKTAERLVVEMKDRLKGWGAGDLFTPATDAAPIDSAPEADTQNADDEAVSALLALGYKPQIASKVVSQIAKSGMTSEEIIREALKSMV